MSDQVRLKIPKDSPIARCITVIRKIEPSLSIADINSRIKNGECVLSYNYTDDDGIKKIIKCYEALSKHDITPRLFGLEDTECDIDFLRDLCGMCEEISDEIDSYLEDESEEAKIFEYKLSNAWLFPIVSLSIYDRAEENVKCLVWYSTNAPQDLQLSRNYSLDVSVIKQIKAIIESNSSLFEIDKVEFPMVLDGFSNRFFFKCGDKCVDLDASNITAWEHIPKTIDNEEPVNAKLILKVYEMIKALLSDNGVDDRYLSLEW